MTHCATVPRVQLSSAVATYAHFKMTVALRRDRRPAGSGLVNSAFSNGVGLQLIPDAENEGDEPEPQRDEGATREAVLRRGGWEAERAVLRAKRVPGRRTSKSWSWVKSQMA